MSELQVILKEQDVAKPTLSSPEAVEIMATATQFLVQLTHKISDKARSL